MGIISSLLFGDNSNKTSYKDAAYDKYYRDITENTFDSMYDGSKNYLNNNYSGGYDKLKSDTLFGLQDRAKNSVANYNATKNEVFGNGLIGGILNPVAQTVGGLGSLAGLALSGGKVNPWDGSNDPIGAKRDWLSDLGALGETALTAVPMAKGLSLAKAGKAVRAGTATAKQAAKVAASQAPKTLGQKVASGALVGGAYGTAGSLRDMGYENFDLGSLLRSAAIGGAMGGGLSAAGYGIDKLANRARGVRNVADMYQQYLSQQNPNALALTSSQYTQPSAQEWLLNRGSLAKTRLGQALQGAGDTISYNKLMGKGIGSRMANSKIGSNASRILKTKAGKVGAGVGGGLLLSQLLNNKGEQ